MCTLLRVKCCNTAFCNLTGLRCSVFQAFFGSELTVKLGYAVLLFKVAGNYKAKLSSELTGLQRKATQFLYYYVISLSCFVFFFVILFTHNNEV